jgi:small subunit ribosomal protein S17
MPKRILTGTIVSDKAEKTVVVKVERRVKHPLYGKIIKLSKKYHAHDEDNAFKEGETVRIEETRPMSKLKTWRVVDRVDTHATPEKADVAYQSRRPSEGWGLGAEKRGDA